MFAALIISIYRRSFLDYLHKGRAEKVALNWSCQEIVKSVVTKAYLVSKGTEILLPLLDVSLRLKDNDTV